ncbi:MAG: isochorismate synthase [Chlamydiales bacterium]
MKKIYWADREGISPPPHCTFHFCPFSSLHEYSSAVRQTDLPTPAHFKVVKRRYSPTQEEWKRGVEQTLRLMQQEKLEKVVLARTCTLELEEAPDPFAIAASLKPKAQGAFLFCVQSDTEGFLGATPERLFARNGRNLRSEAVAGTRRRGVTAEEDEALQKELLSSAKDIREFIPVQTYLKNALSPLCLTPLSFTPVTVHRTQNVQHLYSQCSGILKKETTDQEILSSLHPTPALCGAPKQKAYSVIREFEQFDRGLYGGVIGWTTSESSEWIVGIRSCLIRGKTATLFSGTGVVEGSDAEEEWDELNQKLRLYDGIFI